MIVSFTHRFVYIATPRTGSTSLYQALKQAAGAECLPYGQAPSPCYERDVNGFHDPFVVPELKEFFVFASFRNPYSRIVSHYQFAIADSGHRLHGLAASGDFPHYVQVAIAGGLLATQMRFIGDTRLDAKVYQEGDLADQINLLPPFLSLRLVVDRTNVSNGAWPWYAHYDEATIQRVAQWAEEDFRLLGYSPSFADAVAGKLPTPPSLPANTQPLPTTEL